MIDSKAIRSKYIQGIIDDLAKEGMEIIRKAYASKNTKDRLMNERDAYVYGVFYRGTLQKYGFIGEKKAQEKANGWNKAGISPFFGRDVARDVITSFEPQEKAGFELVVLVATFYSNINEGRGYKIISQSLLDLSKLGKKYKGSRIRVIDLYNGQN